MQRGRDGSQPLGIFEGSEWLKIGLAEVFPMRLILAVLAFFAAGAALAQTGVLPDDDNEQDDNQAAVQCIVEALPSRNPITCDAAPGPADSPCFCPYGGPTPGRRVPADQ